jgi:O-antigen/teichoic acid export membrane protein
VGSLARNTILLTLAKFFSVAIYAFFGLVLPRHVSVADNGIYALMGTLLFFSSMIGTFGVPLVITREVARAPAAAARLWASGRAAMALGTGAALLLMACWLAFETAGVPKDAGRKWVLFAAVAVIVFADAFGSLGDAIFQGFERMTRPALIEIGTGLTRAGGAIAAMLLLPMEWRLEGIFACFLIGSLARAALIERMLRREIFPGARPARASAAEAWALIRSSGNLALFRVLRVVRNRLDVLLIGILVLSFSATANPDEARSLYGQGIRLAIVFHTITLAFSTALWPRFARWTADGKDLSPLREPYARAVRWQAWWATPMAAGLLFYAVPVCSWFGEKYVTGIPEMLLAGTAAVLPFLLIATYLDCIGGPVGMVMMGVPRLEKLIPWIGGVLAGSSILLNVFLIPRYGVLGAAYSATAAASLEFLIKMVIVGRVLGHPIRILAGTLPYLLLAAVMIAGLWLLGWQERPFLGALAGGAFYFGACLLLGLTDPAVTKILHRLRGGAQTA